jgi:hypothetical protein
MIPFWTHFQKGPGLSTSASAGANGMALPVRPLATVILGALDEAALYLADPGDSEEEQARADVRAVVHDLIDGMFTVR